MRILKLTGEPKATPIFMGSDENAYGQARAYHELYGKKAIVYAGGLLAATKYTDIIDMHVVPGFGEDPVFIETMRELAKEYATHAEPVVLIGLGDKYPPLIAKHADELRQTFVVPYVDYELLERLIYKNTFSEIADQYGLPHPKSVVLAKDELPAQGKITSPWGYPVVLKAADSVEWVDLHFEGRAKVYILNSEDELDKAVRDAYAHGYHGKFILQDAIPGDASQERNVTGYVDQHHHLQVISLGHPVLEDPTPWGIGNFAAILPDYDAEVYRVAEKFLTALNYTGFFNMDFKYDTRDNTFKFFEMNIRPGRSSYWATLNGVNWVGEILSDYGNQRDPQAPTTYANQDTDKYQLWLQIPAKMFIKYAPASAEKTAAVKLIKQGRYGFTYKYKPDWNWKRRLMYMRANQLFRKSYKQYFGSHLD